MKFATAVITCLCTGALLASCKKESVYGETPVQKTQSIQSKAGTSYQLVWADEFNGTTVNTANWNFETGGGGWGNNELQYYQPQNATISNGSLVITAKKERVKSNSYTSARMTTQGKQEFLYGKVEARMKLPLVKGLWPAFWMLGSNIKTVGWPACGETDIMEHINTENSIYATMHWDNNGHASYGGSITTTPADWHVYSIEWDTSAIRWYVDAVQFHEGNILNGINGTSEFHQPFFIILNLAVGGNWPGKTIDTKSLPASLYVDYVRVYKAI